MIKHGMVSSAMVCTLLAGATLAGCSDDSESPRPDAGTSSDVDNATAADGHDGADGEDGADGTDGVDGTDGTDGTDGADGQPGAPGANGTQPKPAALLVSTPKRRSAVKNATFAFGCSAGNCNYECSVDHAAAAPCTSPVSLDGLSVGPHVFSVIAGTTAEGFGAETSFAWETRKPNILYIMADDLGYSDVHALGGEIDTPNLDELVGEGHILTNHHTGTVSAITRSMLISGTDHHLVGEGTMGAPSDERRGLPGYEGYLNDRSLSVAELLKDGGYHTYIAGKWHIGSGLAGSTGSGYTPDQWGFEQSYVLLGGAASNHYAHEAAGSKNYASNGAYVQPGQPGQPGGAGGSPEQFYSTDFYTQQLLKYIDADHADGKPFFAYAAFTSPHWPLQVPEPWLSQYRGRYDAGYDVIRQRRIERLQDLGIISPALVPHVTEPETLTRSLATPNNGTANARYISAVHAPGDGYVDYNAGFVNKRWESLSTAERKAQARYMEIYAGMVSNLDHNIGLLIQHLKDIGEYDDTFIMFQSDNGAEGWPIDSGADPRPGDEANAQPGVFEKLGTDNGLVSAKRLQYGLRWAEVSATPFAQVKGQFGEGGYSVPAVVRLPGQDQSGAKLQTFTHVTDNTATFLALAGVSAPTQPAPASVDPVTNIDRNAGKVAYKGRAVYPVTGKSFLPALDTGKTAVHTAPFADESYGRAYVFSADGKWKARWTEPPFGPVDGHWELFDVTIDRGETRDVSADHPAVVSGLVADWNAYMTSVGGVEPLRPRGFY